MSSNGDIAKAIAKYNLPLSAKDVYPMDNPVNGNYDHDLTRKKILSNCKL